MFFRCALHHNRSVWDDTILWMWFCCKPTALHLTPHQQLSALTTCCLQAQTFDAFTNWPTKANHARMFSLSVLLLIWYIFDYTVDYRCTILVHTLGCFCCKRARRAVLEITVFAFALSRELLELIELLSIVSAHYLLSMCEISFRSDQLRSNSVPSFVTVSASKPSFARSTLWKIIPHQAR